MVPSPPPPLPHPAPRRALALPRPVFFLKPLKWRQNVAKKMDPQQKKSTRKTKGRNCIVSYSMCQTDTRKKKEKGSTAHRMKGGARRGPAPAHERTVGFSPPLVFFFFFFFLLFSRAFFFLSFGGDRAFFTPFSFFLFHSFFVCVFFFVIRRGRAVFYPPFLFFFFLLCFCFCFYFRARFLFFYSAGSCG